MAMVIQDDFWEACKAMPKSQRAGFIYALVAYGMDGTEPEGRPAWLPSFLLVRGRVDMSNERSARGRAMADARWGARKDAQGTGSTADGGCTGTHAGGCTGICTGICTDACTGTCTGDAQAPRPADAESESESESEKNPYSPLVRDVVHRLNERCGTAFKPTTPKTRSLIAARAREGATLADFERVIDRMAREWMGDPKMRRYLRPETLFGTKFDGYLNSPGGGGPDGMGGIDVLPSQGADRG